MEKLDPQGGASLHPSGLSGFIYEECHETLLHMKYKSFGPYSFIEYKCTELNNAMATTVYYSISQNLMQSFHLHEDVLHEILIKLAPYTLYYFDSVDGSSNGCHSGPIFFKPEKNLEFFRLKNWPRDDYPGKLE